MPTYVHENGPIQSTVSSCRVVPPVWLLVCVQVTIEGSPHSANRYLGLFCTLAIGNVGSALGYTQPRKGIGLTDLSHMKRSTNKLFIRMDSNKHSPLWGPQDWNKLGHRWNKYILH